MEFIKNQEQEIDGKVKKTEVKKVSLPKDIP